MKSKGVQLPKPGHVKMAEALFSNGKGLHSSVAETDMKQEHWDKLAGAVGEKSPGAFDQYQALGHLKKLEDAKDVIGEFPKL